jgi:hypothetical protein
MAAAPETAYDPHDAPDDRMNTVVLEIGLLLLSAVTFWVLDRYVVGCDTI